MLLRWYSTGLYEVEDSVYARVVNSSRTSPGRREKIKLMFIFILLCGASKGFMKALKVFIKPFEAPRRSMKIKNLT